jgi:hypothetical protein
MPSVADYTVLRDGSFDLIETESFELPPWSAPSNFVAGTNKARPIIMYKARPLPNSPFSPFAKINVRDKFGAVSFDTVTLRGDTVHSLFECIQGDDIESTIVNTFFEFRCLQGKVRISDVVLWYQVNV